MTKKLWIIWAMCLMVPGGLGLVVYSSRESTFRTQIAQAREAESKDSTVRDYLQMYEQWSVLEPEEKADNPWGFGDFGGADIRQQLRTGQSDRLLVDSAQLAKGINHYPDPLAEVIYGSGWQQKVDEFEKSQAESEMLLTGSIFLAACGGLILFGGITKVAICTLIRIRKSKKADKDVTTKERQVKEAKPQKDVQLKQPQPQEPSVSKPEDSESDEDAEDTEENDESSSDDETSESDSDFDSDAEATTGKPNQGYFGGRKKTSTSPSSSKSIPSLSPVGSLSSTESLIKETKDSYFGWAVDEHETPALEKLMTSEPLTRDLSALTEEVSAIREFAAQQQDQVRKLQDGYDWMIIRRFCQRIIRSIDNIEDRFAGLKEAGDTAADYLEDIRDELIFALESSGVEQFKPDLHAPFKGLEKYVEAVRERIGTDDESSAGTIAEIIRPGYQYLVSDDEVKIIRCAQVKLYEKIETSS